MKEPNMTNPSFAFYDFAGPHILSTRIALLHNFSKRSIVLSSGAEELMRKSLLQSSTPALGELIPWLIADLFDINKLEITDIATAWLKVYIYTGFIDDALDENKILVPREALAASILLQEGSAILFKIVADTQYEELLTKSLYAAAEGELFDVEEQSYISDNKMISAEKKNFIFLACAAALAARAGKKGKQIVEFSEAILLGLQYLDDIADFEHDYVLGNYTALLADAFKIITVTGKQLARHELLRILILSKSLTFLLGKTATILENAVLVASRDATLTSSTAGLFLQRLVGLLKSAEAVVIEAEMQLQFSSLNEKVVLDRVENALKKVAQSS